MIEIYRRNNYSVQAQYTDDNNVPIDLTGYFVKIILKKLSDKANHDDNALVNKSFQIIDGVNGIFEIQLESDETNFNAGNYKFEVQLSKDNEFITVYQDKLVIKESYIYE